MKSNPSLSDFPVAMIAACEAALDAAIFYDDAFQAFARQHMGGYGCKATLIEVVEMDASIEKNWEMRKAMHARIYADVIAAPRGHYIVVRTQREQRIFFKTYVSDGHGDQLAVGGSHDTYDMMPSADKVLDRMVGYEVYLCRKAIEANRYYTKCIGMMREFGLHIGFTFKGEFKFNADKFSTVTITQIVEATGQIKVHLTKRGSSKRYEAWLGADSFVIKAGLDKKLIEATSMMLSPASLFS